MGENEGRLYVVFEHHEQKVGDVRLELVGSFKAHTARGAAKLARERDEGLRVKLAEGPVQVAVMPASTVSLVTLGEAPAPAYLGQEQLRIANGGGEDG